MNIVIVNRHLHGWRGGVRVSVELANGLSRRGHRTAFVAPGAQTAHCRYALSPLVQHIPVEACGWESTQLLESTLNAFPHERSLIIVGDWEDAACFSQCCTTELYALIHLIQAFDRNEVSSFGNSARGSVRADFYVTVSNWLRQLLLDHFDINAAVIQPFVADRFLSSSRQHVPAPNPAVLYVGPLTPEKRLPLLIDAVTALRRSYKTMELWIATGDEFIPERLPNNIYRFYPRTDEDLVQLYARASVLVIPNEWEGFGLAAVEAMAVGTPVVIANSGGSLEYARHEVNCLMFEAGSRGSLAYAISRTLSGPPDMRTQEAVKTAALFSSERMLGSWETLLRQMWDGNFRRAPVPARASVVI